MKFSCSIVVVLGLALVSPVALGAPPSEPAQAVPKPAAAPQPPLPPAQAKPDAAPANSEIGELLASPDAGKQKEGIAHLRKYLETDANHAAAELRGGWLKAMMDGHHYEEVNEFTGRLIAMNPADTNGVQSLLDMRIHALLAAGKPDKALAQAKALYNIATMGDTATAMRRVAECLNAAHPDDFTVTDKFRTQQQAGAAPTTRPATAAEVSASVLGGIHIDGQEYRDTINHMIDEDFETLLGKGNLLLLSDRSHDAMGVFERAYGIAAEKQLQLASEAIARAMKAEDGSIGRANAWVMSIRPKH